MNQYQIVDVNMQGNHAGIKATSDVFAIAEEMGFLTVKLQMLSEKSSVGGKILRQIGYFICWIKGYKKIRENSIVLLQNPFRYRQYKRNFFLQNLKEKKNVKYISVIHDVEELRQSLFNEYYQKEFETMIKLSDVFIVHNNVMKKFFIDKGISEERIVILEIFDYLQETEIINEPFFDKSITIAGNLDISKSAYIYQLNELTGVKCNLYGPNFNSEQLSKCSNICYHGSFPTDEITSKLKSGFGLVWDGNRIDTCSGAMGNYLRINNPHKLSLYLASGLPVVIWNQAAEAEFVKATGVGICVSSLQELTKIFATMTVEQYQGYVNNVQQIADKLCNGCFMKKAIEKAINIVKVL